MPTLPLYDTAADPDAWHRVAAPGGYEWWRFDAEDAGRKLRVTIELFDGDPFDEGYLRAYRQYRRRPTRLAPPVPREYPRARLVVIEAGRLLRHVDRRLEPGSVGPAGDGEGLRVGPWTLRGDDEGAGGVVISATELPVSALGETRDVRLAFRPRDPRPPELRRFDAGERSAVDHWVECPSGFDVGVAFTRPAGDEAGTDLVFEGRGRFDHFYGTGPMGNELRARIRTL
jgi:hypothetical protein